MSPHSPVPLSRLCERVKSGSPPLCSSHAKRQLLMGVGAPQGPGPPYVTRRMVYASTVSHPSFSALRLSCVRTSGSRPYLGLCNLDVSKAVFRARLVARGGPEADGVDGCACIREPKCNALR